MILWFIYFLISLVCMVLCYITNPFVVPFADINGELPDFLKYWQTWDNSVFCKDSVDCAPSFLKYDWERHYMEHLDSDPYLHSVNRQRWYVSCKDPNFTLRERIQRYCCGTLWLTRNCSYGFAFYLLGLNISTNLEIRQSENTIFVREIFADGLFGAWMYKDTAKIFSLWGYEVHWNNLLGWKIDTSAQLDTRAMIANRIAFYVKREGE